MVECHRVVHAVSEERDIGSVQSLHADDPRLRRRADSREDRRLADRDPECLVVHRIDLRARQRDNAPESEIATHLYCNLPAVSRDHLDRDPEPIEACKRRGGVSLGLIDEHQEPHEPEMLLVRVTRDPQLRCEPRGHRNDPGAGVVKRGGVLP